MKRFILLLARVFKVNVIDGDFIEKHGDNIIIKGNLRICGDIRYYCSYDNIKEE